MSSSTPATSTNYSRVPQQEGPESGGGGGGGSSTPTTAASSSAGGNNDNNNRNSNNNNNRFNNSSTTSSVLQLRSRTERLQDKGVAVCWVVLAYFVARWSKFFSYVLWGITSTATTATASSSGESDNSSSDPPPSAAAVIDVNIIILRLALIGFGIVTLLGLYLTVYLPRFKGLALKDSSGWAPVYCPNVIPSMSVTFLISVLLLIRSVWPVYGFLAPFIVSSQFMALLMSTHLLPTFGLC
eukprot:CAMPEP_0113466118 /NCGR_PEP_ID=MMETSP0014_2-20120614/14101_1 /TAXON_ID=2857 /ORGANISM="Nitzschia sp." /LENGTH=240 /DNA_ID=CAMNT_0000358319 /DNA_START=826 /DNA_END=1548 /DNA_ORIENTATION=- /assembly_acc=CAM_ASM_000159